MAPWTYSASATTSGRRIGHSAFLASARHDFREARGSRDVAGGGAEIIRIAAQQHGAAARREQFRR